MPTSEGGASYVNVEKVLRVVGVLAALSVLATGIVSFVYHPSAPGLRVEATIDNINGGFCVCMLTAFVCLGAAFLFLHQLRAPFFRTQTPFRVGMFYLGLYFVILGVLTIGIAGLLGFCCGIFCCVVGLSFLIARCFCGLRTEAELVVVS